MSTGAPETRESILRAARDLLHDEGAQRVRLADVARRAGISRQAVYLHFGSRVGLLVALVEYVDEVEGLHAHVSRVFGSADSVEALDRLVELHAEFTPRIRPVAEAIVAVRGIDEAAEAAWQNRLESRLDGCRAIVAWLRREGRLAEHWTDEEAADLLWSLTSPHAWRDLVVERGWATDQYVRHLKRVLRELFVR